MKRIATVLLCGLVAMLTLAAPVTDDQLKQLCREAGAAMMGCTTAEERQQAFDKVAGQFAKTTDIMKLTEEQVEVLFENGGITLDPLFRTWLEPVFVQRAGKEPAFAFYRWKYMPENDNFTHGTKETSALIAFLQTKNLQQVLNEHEDYAISIIEASATMKDANWKTEGFAEGMLRLVECKFSEKVVNQCVKVFNSIARVDDVDTAMREKIRKACLAQYEQLLPTIEVARKQKACRENIAYLKGPFACGTLIGGEAPNLHFLRAFKEGKDSVETVDIKDLASLRGKVVMLDFWGTKCVPCIQSFPEIAEMQKHFEGKDVVILGVTSLQGFFYDTPNKKTIQCRNNPEKEIACFPAFMKAMGINWHIAISKEDVMNTDFGVLAIPHVVIIDRNGVVRHNAVNADKEAKIKLIEELLP